MSLASIPSRFADDLPDSTLKFYRGVLHTLDRAGSRFVLGGAYAFNHYTGVNRATRDLDLFIRREDFEQISAALQQAGYDTELTYPHWLGKIHSDGVYIDLIFSSGNGVAVVDELWFEYADEAELLGVKAKISPVEEMIWSKAFIMERERYDGADVAHLFLTCAGGMDWRRLLRRFDGHWRVLLSHLLLFGFIYPAHRNRIPAWVMDDLLQRLRLEMRTAPSHEAVCQGTLLSREQYLSDIEVEGLQDGRLAPFGNMTQEDTESWTQAIPNREQAPEGGQSAH
ncbi:MAG TPA: nucleotidyltransferase [Noviherbaspirillum sp.]